MYRAHACDDYILRIHSRMHAPLGVACSISVRIISDNYAFVVPHSVVLRSSVDCITYIIYSSICVHLSTQLLNTGPGSVLAVGRPLSSQPSRNAGDVELAGVLGERARGRQECMLERRCRCVHQMSSLPTKERRVAVAYRNHSNM